MRYITGTLRDFKAGRLDTSAERFYDREVRHILGTLRDFTKGR